MKLLVLGALVLLLGAAPAVAEDDLTGPTPSVTATTPEPSESTPTPTPPATLVSGTAPTVTGSLRFGKPVTASLGTWSPAPAAYGYRWYRDGAMIAGQTRRSFTPRAQDVGHKIQVRVHVARPGFQGSSRLSVPVVIKHLTDVRRTVTYSVRTKGRITTSLATFKKLAQETYDDPRGWRSNGIRFKQVSSGGSFTLVLAQASKVPSYSSACSAQWSCRVGRNVVINQDRWKNASPAWRRSKGSLRDYRHMVVNHETGHWLGKGHASCSGKGAKAPVMMQQSKALKGCTFNPWPKAGERYAPRFKF